MDDLISRQAAISAIKEWGLLDGLSEGQAIEILADEEKVPSAQPEHLVKESGNLVKGLVNDCISRQAVLDGLASIAKGKAKSDAQKSLMGRVMFFTEQLPSVQTEKMQLSKEDATKGTTFDCISREDAIDVLAYFDEKDPLGHTPQQIIMALPSAQPEPCEDAVSREAVSEWLKQYGQDVLHGKYKFSLMYIWKNLMDLPSAQPEIMHCKDCRHNHNCDIQYHAQAGDMFFCAGAERRTE